MNDHSGPLRGRRRQPRWLQATRGLALVALLAVVVGLVGLLLAWLASLPG